MHNPSFERVALRFLAAAERPGPHWNPWPQSQVGRTLDGFIDYLDALLRNDGAMFWSQYENADERTLITLGQLRDALKRRNQQAAKRFTEGLMRSPYGKAVVDDNVLWAYVIDGRENV